MNNKLIWAGIVIAIAIGIFSLVGVNNQSGLVGAEGDTNFTNMVLDGYMTMKGALTQGGGIIATSSVGAVLPLLASDFDTENVIDVTLNLVDGTISFPATSTLTSFIPVAGQTRTIYIRNASTTATMDLTISGGTGVLLKKATTTAVVFGDTDGANYAKIDLTRKANTDIEALLTTFVD